MKEAMYGWVNPLNQYVGVGCDGHIGVGQHCDSAAKALENIHEHDNSIYQCLYNSGFIRVVTYDGAAQYNGRSRQLADRRDKLTNLAERHGLLAKFHPNAID